MAEKQAGNDKALPESQDKKVFDEQTSQELLKATASNSESYKGAVRSEIDAESNWHHAFSQGQTTLSANDIKGLLKNPDLDAQSLGFMHFLQDNFIEIAGTAAANGKVDNSKISINDVVAIGAMNEVSPAKIEDGVKFLQDNFFQVSGFDDKVTAERVSKIMWDHSFLLFPKQTQEYITDLSSVVKSVDQRPQAFDHNNRIKSGIGADDVKALNPTELSDNLRIQALEKGMFGAGTLKLDAKTLNPKAQDQYKDASQRYAQLKNKLDGFLSK